MIIIPDTSSVRTDYHLSGMMWKLLLANASLAGFTMAWSEVVLLELANRFREKIFKEVHDSHQSLQSIRELTGIDLTESIPQDFGQEELANYNRILRRNVRKYGGKILKLPNISHRKLITRDLQRRKPFKSSGVGYRDALIWETILHQLYTQKDEIAFITENKTDFATSTGSLHDELQEDVIAVGRAVSSVRLYSSVPEFVEQELIPKLPAPHGRFLTYLRKAHPTCDLAGVLEKSLEMPLLEKPIEMEDQTFRWTIEDPSIVTVSNITNVEIIDDRIVSNSRLLEFRCQAECEIFCCIDRSEYLLWNKRRRPAALDFDASHMTAQFFAQVSIRGFVTFNESEASFDSAEVLEVRMLSHDLSR
jgi:hypothetical protein